MTTVGGISFMTRFFHAPSDVTIVGATDAITTVGEKTP